MARPLSSIVMQFLRKRERNVPSNEVEDMPLIPFTDLTVGQRQDVRAAQRTFEGAFVRTAAGQLSFGLVILKLFSTSFTPIGMIYLVNCILLLVFGTYQRRKHNKLFLTRPSTVWRTTGSTVIFTTLLTIFTNIALLVILIRLENTMNNVGLFTNHHILY